MLAAKGRLRAYVVLVRPQGAAPGWEQTDLWRQAAAIPGTILSVDESGREAAYFGAATSGQTLLYDESGHLRFSGGITAARGYYGDNAGSGAILALLGNSKASLSSTPVYGCPLLTPGLKVRACKH